MAWEYDIASRLRGMAKEKARAAWYRAECVSVSPLRFSVHDGALMFSPGEGLAMTATAAGREWRVGDGAAAILSGGGLLVIDRM